jgi:transposase
MTGRSQQREGAEAFTAPAQVNQRRYEALRAYFVDGLSHAEAGERLGYTRWAMINLARDYRAGKLELFAPPRRPGPPPGAAPAKDRARGRVIALRRQGLSTYEISARLAAEGIPLNRTSVGEILAEEGFGRLLRHPEPEASASPATAGRDTTLPRASVIDFDDWPARADTGMAGLLLVIPDLIALDLPALVAAAGYPDTRVIPAVSWMLSLLALKLTATRRVSHVDDLLIVDPAAALLAGLAVLPKKSALTGYSYRLSHDHQRAFLAALDAKMIGAGLAAGEEAIFDLDFHAVMVCASHCSLADCESQNRPVWAGGGSIRRPFARPVRTWTACSSPRLTRCNRVWRDTPWARMASRTGSQPAGASSANNACSLPVMRIRQGAPGVSCSPGTNPSLTHRCRVEGASPSWRAASATVRSSPSGGSSLG